MSIPLRILPWLLATAVFAAAPPLPADGDWPGWVRLLAVPESQARAEGVLKAAGEKAHPALVAALGHDEWPVREAAGAFLASQGEKALPALVPALSSADPETASRSLELVEAVVRPRYNPYSWVGIRMGADGAGVRVYEVLQGSPAEKAGFKPGDVVVRLDGKALGDDFGSRVEGPAVRRLVLPDGRVVIVPAGSAMEDPCQILKDRVTKAPPGTKMTFTILREGKNRDLQARLEPMPEEMLEPEQREEIQRGWEAWLKEARKTGKPPPLPAPAVAGPPKKAEDRKPEETSPPAD